LGIKKTIKTRNSHGIIQGKPKEPVSGSRAWTIWTLIDGKYISGSTPTQGYQAKVVLDQPSQRLRSLQNDQVTKKIL
jgi:hypothetical protein